MIELNIDRADSGGYLIRVGCPCGHLHCEPEPLHLDRPKQPGNEQLEAAWRERLDRFWSEHPDGFECASCGEHSTRRDGPPLAVWTHPELAGEAA